MKSEIDHGNKPFTYLTDYGIYVIDYSGRISLANGLSNMDYIEKAILKLPRTEGCVKIIFDVRNTMWESREVHDTLSKVARKIFCSDNLGFVIYAAILNNEIDGSATDFEHWFVQKEDAIKWLTQVK
jgi:hypothetical protein